MDGLLALTVWDIVIDVLEPLVLRTGRDRRVNSNPKHQHTYRNPSIIFHQTHWISSNRAHFFIFEDNKAVIKIIIKGRSSHLRHVSRVHRVDLDWFFGRTNLTSNVSVRYVHTNQQVADMFNETFIQT